MGKERKDGHVIFRVSQSERDIIQRLSNYYKKPFSEVFRMMLSEKNKEVTNECIKKNYDLATFEPKYYR